VSESLRFKCPCRPLSLTANPTRIITGTSLHRNVIAFFAGLTPCTVMILSVLIYRLFRRRAWQQALLVHITPCHCFLNKVNRAY
jgi:hypothetical protein